MNDIIAFFGMAFALGLGIWGAIANQILCFRIGSIVTSVAACVGFAYGGWKPFFGGVHDPGTYFGCIMVIFGFIGWLLFRGISDANPPGQDRK